jgi:SAM-dependent methyltransferase
MHPNFLPILRCPETGGPLALNAERTNRHSMIITGALISPTRRRYPIVRGVPRFVSAEQYASSFGYEWTRWPRVQFESENRGRPMEGHTTRMWERITSASDVQVQGKTILDFGCGPGRFLDVVRRKGGLAVGIDLSAAVDAARENFADDPDVLIVQADLFRPPFAPGSFDGGYSIGVLHHTPDPAGGLHALADLVRPGGWVSCCVYPKDDFYDFPSVRRFRQMHLRVRRWFGYGAAMGYAHLAAYVIAPLLRSLKQMGLRKPMNYVERHLLVSLYLKDVRWRVLDTFDAITPQIASTHTTEEVAGWLEQARCRDVRVTPWCPTSLSAQRAA